MRCGRLLRWPPFTLLLLAICSRCSIPQPGMQEGLEPVEAEGLSAPELAMVQLLAVLARWHACMPEAFAEARYDVQRLLPQAGSFLIQGLQSSIFLQRLDPSFLAGVGHAAVSRPRLAVCHLTVNCLPQPASLQNKARHWSRDSVVWVS